MMISKSVTMPWPFASARKNTHHMPCEMKCSSPVIGGNPGIVAIQKISSVSWIVPPITCVCLGTTGVVTRNDIVPVSSAK